MAPIIYNISNAVFKNKMAAFDYDWTLVNPKGGKTFPTDVDDWEWLYPSVPTNIKQYYDDGYMIVIFTNQTKPWKCEQIRIVAESLGVPLFVVIAMEKSEHKPNIVLFNHLMGDHVINKEESFFIGDALGRKTDFSDSDKVFAENIGIKWTSPDALFSDPKTVIKIPEIVLSDTPEIIILMGFPGSGKSTIARRICKNDKYLHIEGDVYKTPAKMIKKSLEYIDRGKSIVFDATHSSAKKRKEYVNLGKKYNYAVRCIHVAHSLEISYKRNKERGEDKQVPKVAFHLYSKMFEKPDESEGFILETIS